METAKEYYTLINKINLLWREDKSRIQFPLFVREVCCFPHSLMREREVKVTCNRHHYTVCVQQLQV